MPREFRLIAIVVTWAVWTWATTTLPAARASHNLWLEVVKWSGFILGNYVYAQLWLAEGRDRERADREKPPIDQ
jgi:hypothetical protein